MSADFIGIFLSVAGFTIGLGAVTVIDLHGFLGRHSQYWTEATTRTHKITKPLIWIGTFLAAIGGVVLYWGDGWTAAHIAQAIILFFLILNGLFLSFSVSPHLLEREQKGTSAQLLSRDWQQKITMSFIISFLGWWSQVILFSAYLASSMFPL